MRKWVLVLTALVLLVVMSAGKEGIYVFVGIVGTEGQNYAYVIDVTDHADPVVLLQSSAMDVPDVIVIVDYAYFGASYVMAFYECTDLVVVDISRVRHPLDKQNASIHCVERNRGILKKARRVTRRLSGYSDRLEEV